MEAQINVAKWLHRHLPHTFLGGVDPVAAVELESIGGIDFVPGLVGCVISPNRVHLRSECNNVQGCCSVFICEGGVAHHVPAGMEGDGLVGGWLGAWECK